MRKSVVRLGFWLFGAIFSLSCAIHEPARFGVWLPLIVAIGVVATVLASAEFSK